MNARVLLVDDEPKILSALCRTLRAEGYMMFTANGAQQALDLVNVASFDVVVSDITMPGVNGVALMGEMRRRCPDTVRIMLTGLPDLGVALRAVEEGAVFRYFTKPWNDVELRVAMRQAIAHGKARLEARHLLDFMDRNHNRQLDALVDAAPKSFAAPLNRPAAASKGSS
jgi:DNA-binding NtrC family response regulator